MTVPTWSLPGFAAWTVLLLSMSGVYRWSRIYRPSAIGDFRPVSSRGRGMVSALDADPCELHREPAGSDDLAQGFWRGRTCAP